MNYERQIISMANDATKVCKAIYSCITAEQLASSITMVKLFEKKWQIEQLTARKLLIARSFWGGYLGCAQVFTAAKLRMMLESK